MFKIGIGYDFHILKEGRPLMLGGVHIPHNKGEEAHSDGDVLLHAIIDALLGADGFLDLGEMFPPRDAKWKDAPSSLLLQLAWQKVKERDWHVENIDSVVMIEEPKLNPYRKDIITSIANLLGIEPDRVFVKFKTHEKRGEIGAGDAVASTAIALISK